MQDQRIAKCLTAKRESKAVEFKEQFDPSDSRQSLELLKDIAAIANSGGGTIAIGINNAGNGCASDIRSVLDYDHAKYCDLIKKYTMQNFADFELIEAEKDGHTVAMFLINPPDSPLIFEKPGTYPIEDNKQKTVFSQGTVYFRHGAKSETGTTDDIRRFIQQRVREMQDQLVKGMRKVSDAPRGSQLQVVPRGTVVAGLETAIPVKITDDPSARGAIVVDRDQIFRFRRKDVIERLKKELTAGTVPNSFELQAVNAVYDIAANEKLSWKPQFSSRLYSDAFIEWLVANISKDKNFVSITRKRFSEAKRKKKD
jgi:hypothetical protein